MAGKRKKVNEKQLFELARIGCTDKEIAAVMDISDRTVRDNFSAILIKGREQGKQRLRRLQWKSAEKGNVTMLIWLGKQLLDQKDKNEHTGKDGGAMRMILETVGSHGNSRA
jgi:hypothetical protein